MSPLPLLRFPDDLLRLLYWAFFKPFTLQRYLRQFDSELKIDAGLITLWRRGKAHPELRDLVGLALCDIALLPWLPAFILAGSFALAGFAVNWIGVAGGVAFGVAFGVAWGVAWGVAGGVAFGVAGSVADGVAVGVAFWIGYFRLLPYLFELPLSLFLAWRGARLELSPLYWDELIWLPLGGLDRQIVAVGQRDRPAAQAAIAHAAQSFRQGWAAQSALLQLAAQDVEQAQTPPAIAAIAAALAWLPPDLTREWAAFLPGLYETAAHVQAALESDTPYNRQAQFRRALERSRGLRQGLALVRDRRLAQRFGPALQTWEAIFEGQIAALERQQAGQIPNVYVAGLPLKDESRVFKGRRDLFRTLEQELTSAADPGPTPAGRRRGRPRPGPPAAPGYPRPGRLAAPFPGRTGRALGAAGALSGRIWVFFITCLSAALRGWEAIFKDEG